MNSHLALQSAELFARRECCEWLDSHKGFPSQSCNQGFAGALDFLEYSYALCFEFRHQHCFHAEILIRSSDQIKLDLDKGESGQGQFLQC